MATLVRKRFDPEPEPDSSGKTAEELEAEEALLDRVHEYVERNCVRLEVFEIAGEESRRNGTDRMTMEEINAVISESRAERAARAANQR